MNKITQADLWDYVSEVGESEKEFRKYSSFYITTSHTIRQEDVDELAKEDLDASDFLNVLVSRNGMWDDSYGTEWDNEITYQKVEEYQVLIPEKVIPEHYITKVKSTAFVPVWREE